MQLGLLACAEQREIYPQYAIYNGLNTAVTPFEYAASREATQGYILFNAGLGGDLQSRGHKSVRFLSWQAMCLIPHIWTI